MLGILWVFAQGRVYLTHHGEKVANEGQKAVVNLGLAVWGGNNLHPTERGLLWAGGIFGQWSDPVV